MVNCSREKFLLWAEWGEGGERGLIKNDRGLKVVLMENYNFIEKSRSFLLTFVK